MNVGTITLIAISTLLFLRGLLYSPLMRLKKKLQCSKPGRIFLNASRALVIAVCVLVLVESNLMLAAVLNTPTSESTLIVLGSQVKRDGPSVMTTLRLEAAIDYLNEYPEAKCILSGGQGANEPWSEAKGMADYLILKGISGSRLYLEDKSTSTRENLKYSVEIIEREQLNPNVTIVTNAFHTYRAGRIAKRLGIEFTSLPAKSYYFILPSYFIRELYAIIADWILYSQLT